MARSFGSHRPIERPIFGRRQQWERSQNDSKERSFLSGGIDHTGGVPNVVVELPKPHDFCTEEEREKTDETFSKPEQIAAALK
jgi:hypothetical protein